MGDGARARDLAVGEHGGVVALEAALDERRACLVVNLLLRRALVVHVVEREGAVLADDDLVYVGMDPEAAASVVELLLAHKRPDTDRDADRLCRCRRRLHGRAPHAARKGAKPQLSQALVRASHPLRVVPPLVAMQSGNLAEPLLVEAPPDQPTAPGSFRSARPGLVALRRRFNIAKREFRSALAVQHVKPDFHDGAPHRIHRDARAETLLGPNSLLKERAVREMYTADSHRWSDAHVDAIVLVLKLGLSLLAYGQDLTHTEDMMRKCAAVLDAPVRFVHLNDRTIEAAFGTGPVHTLVCARSKCNDKAADVFTLSTCIAAGEVPDPLRALEMLDEIRTRRDACVGHVCALARRGLLMGLDTCQVRPAASLHRCAPLPLLRQHGRVRRRRQRLSPRPLRPDGASGATTIGLPGVLPYLGEAHTHDGGHFFQ